MLPAPNPRQTIVRVDSFCREHLLPGKYILHKQNHFCGFRVFGDGTCCVQTDCRCHTGRFMAMEAFNPLEYDCAFRILSIKEAAPDPNPRDAAGGSVPVSFVSACTGEPICILDAAPDATIMSVKQQLAFRLNHLPFGIVLTASKRNLHNDAQGGSADAANTSVELEILSAVNAELLLCCTLTPIEAQVASLLWMVRKAVRQVCDCPFFLRPQNAGIFTSGT